MSSLLNKNLKLLKERFPGLSELWQDCTPAPLQIVSAKNGQPTVIENNIPLHSKYNPQKEAEEAVKAFDENKYSAAVFLGFGLGYAPVAFAKRFPQAAIILVESNPSRLLAALNETDWESIFSHKNLILAVGASKEQTQSLLDRYNAKEIFVFKNNAQIQHDRDFFSAVEETLAEGKQRDSVNEKTLEKFSRLWLKNSCINAKQIILCDTIQKFRNKFRGLPFLILAAGPTLSDTLLLLRQLSQKTVTVCVDTALHSCLQYGIEPDFILLSDPQYYCSLHLEFLKSPSSVLVTEIAAWPSVFRFNCREKVLYASQFPIGQYFESRMSKSGSRGWGLGAGGSVSTTAWDFARYCGANVIFMAGLDLGFPKGQTHIRGSQFEQKAHEVSSRLNTAETEGTVALINGALIKKQDYCGNGIFTDKKMLLFAQWFKKNCTEAALGGLDTYSLSDKSLFIEGIKTELPKALLDLPDIRKKKNSILCENSQTINADKSEFMHILNEFLYDLNELSDIAREGINFCNRALAAPEKTDRILYTLSDLDKKILASGAKQAAELVFPTKSRLEFLTKYINTGETSGQIQFSRILYEQLFTSAEECKKFLNKSILL